MSEFAVEVHTEGGFQFAIACDNHVRNSNRRWA